MGALGEAAATIGKDAIETIAEKIPFGEISEKLQKTIRPMMSEFKKTSVGQSLGRLITEDFIPTEHKALQKLVQDNAKLPAHLQEHPNAIYSKASNIASASAFGTNHALAVAHIKAASIMPGLDSAQSHMHAQNLSDHLAMIMHDSKPEAKYRSMDADELAEHNAERKANGLKPVKGAQTYSHEGGMVSEFKTHVATSKENRVPVKTAAVYTHVSDTERMFSSYASKVVAPFIVLPHLQTVFNNVLSTPLKVLAKALAENIGLDSVEHDATEEFANRAGVYASTSYDAFKVAYFGSRGIIAKAAQTLKDNKLLPPSVDAHDFGVIVNKLTHQPGFNTARKWQLSFTAAAGRHSAEHWAQQFIDTEGKKGWYAASQNRRARFELHDLGLNVGEIKMQHGQLNPDQMEKAIFNHVDRKVFLDNRMHRSYYSGANPYMRIGGMYHSYVARQSQLLKHEVAKLIKTGDPTLFPQLVAALGIVFPMAGLATKNLTMISRGEWSDITPKKDFENLTMQHGGKAALSEFLEDWSHAAVFGITNSYIRGATRYKTANAIIGPMGNMGANLADDTGHLIHDAYTKQQLHGKHLVKDIVEDSLPLNAGKIISNTMLPSKAQEAHRHPKYKRHSSIKGIKKH